MAGPVAVFEEGRPNCMGLLAPPALPPNPLPLPTPPPPPRAAPNVKEPPPDAGPPLRAGGATGRAPSGLKPVENCPCAGAGELAALFETLRADAPREKEVEEEVPEKGPEPVPLAPVAGVANDGWRPKGAPCAGGLPPAEIALSAPKEAPVDGAFPLEPKVKRPPEEEEFVEV